MKALKAFAALILLAVLAIAVWIWNDVARMRSQIARSRDSHYSERVKDAFLSAEPPETLVTFMVKEHMGARRGPTETLRAALVTEVIERITPKDQVLSTFLDTVYLGRAGGEVLYGVPAGARGYFSKSADELTVAEAATLAGIVRNPSYDSPLEHPKRALERRKVVLDRMRASNFISDEEFAAAVRAPLLK